MKFIGGDESSRQSKLIRKGKTGDGSCEWCIVLHQLNATHPKERHQVLTKALRSTEPIRGTTERLSWRDVFCPLCQSIPDSFGLTPDDTLRKIRHDHREHDPLPVGRAALYRDDRSEIPARARVCSLLPSPFKLCDERYQQCTNRSDRCAPLRHDLYPGSRSQSVLRNEDRRPALRLVAFDLH